MSRINRITIAGAEKAPFWYRFFGVSGSPRPLNAWDNGFVQKAASTSDTDATDIPLIGTNASNQVVLGGSVFTPVLTTRTFTLSTSASLTTQAFWIADQAYTITAISQIHSVANGATMTGVIAKASGTTAPADATSLMSGSFNLNATANTAQNATLSTNTQTISVAAGDRLVFIPTGTLTSLAGVTITITLTPGNRNEACSYVMNLNGDIGTTAIFTATRPCIVTSIQEVHSALGTNGSAVTITVTKDTGTDAPGAGTAMLTTPLSLKAAINTVQTGTLTGTAATLRLNAGDRISVLTAGTLTAVAGVVVTVTMQPITDGTFAKYTLKSNTNLADQTFFIADQSYQVIAVSEVHSTAGTNGSAVSLQVTADKATDAPGAGTDLLTSTGFDLKGTANTVQNGTLTSRGSTFLLAGDRLSVDYAGTLTSLAGVQVTVELIAV